MAMNNSNYGYPPTGYSSPYSSTPTGMRTQRPRFGYSGPSLYPRPRSSASKPNPDSFSDSMINNYGSSPSRINTSFNSENGNSFNDSYHHTSGSNYYSANESFFSPDHVRGDSVSMRGNAGLHRNDSDLMQNDTGVMRGNAAMYGDTNVMHNNTNMMRGDKSLHGDMYNTGILPDPTSQYGAPKHFYNNSFGQNSNMGEYKGNFQKNSSPKFGVTNTSKKVSFAARRFSKAKRRMATKQEAWRCDLCSLDFTSQIPYDMHLRGARHAKKLKAKEALNAVQSQVVKGVDGEKAFFCELCNVKANSSMQLQTHLEGSKHKSKLQPKEIKEEPQDGAKEVTSESVNGKPNGSLTRSLPSDFGEPQPSKLTKFACEVCSISVNSEIQLQQHLSSKKHQNKVEGKPVIKGKKNKMEENKDAAPETNAEMTNVEPEQAANETSKMVVGVKTLASSFVQGGTLQ